MDYKIKDVTVHKSVKINLGNYETCDIGYGFTVEPTVEIVSKADLEIFVDEVSKDVNEMLQPQITKIKEWAKTRVKQ